MHIVKGRKNWTPRKPNRRFELFVTEKTKNFEPHILFLNQSQGIEPSFNLKKSNFLLPKESNPIFNIPRKWKRHFLNQPHRKQSNFQLKFFNCDSIKILFKQSFTTYLLWPCYHIMNIVKTCKKWRKKYFNISDSKKN